MKFLKRIFKKPSADLGTYDPAPGETYPNYRDRINRKIDRKLKEVNNSKQFE